MSFTLSHGLWRDGVCHREAEVRALRGTDEAQLAEAPEASFVAHRVTELLARTVVGLGSLPAVGADSVRSLTVGDRQALLLHLRLLTFGDRMPCVLPCPECGEMLDLDLSVGDLLAAPAPEPRERHECKAGGFRVRLRLPTGEDQEAVGTVAMDDPHGAAALVLRHCVESVRSEDGSAVEAPELPEEVTRELPGVMARLDPQAETRLAIRCPSCGAPFEADLDAADYLFRELSLDAADLERDVHTLASQYHWSEPEILALSPRKRRRYLELVAQSAGVGTS